MDMEHTSRGRKFSRTRKTSTLIHSINVLPLRCHSAATPPLLRTENAMKTNTFWDVLRRYPTATPPRLRRYSAATPPLLRQTAMPRQWENVLFLDNRIIMDSTRSLPLCCYSATTPLLLRTENTTKTIAFDPHSATTPPLLRRYSAATPPGEL